MLKIYKIPNNFISCFIGAFGVGKTLGMLEAAILMADKYNLDIVANFPIDIKVFRYYCTRKKYYTARLRRVIYIEDFQEFFQYRNCIFLLDEAGLELFSRDFKSRGKEIFRHLFQIRKYKSFLFYSCQSYHQLDRQLRDVTQLFIECKGFQTFSTYFRSMRLKKRSQRAFDREAYEILQADPILSTKFFRPLLLCQFRISSSNLAVDYFKAWLGILAKAWLGSFFSAVVYALDRKNIAYFFVFIEKQIKKATKHGVSDDEVLFQIYDSFGLVSRDETEDYSRNGYSRPSYQTESLDQYLLIKKRV